MPVARKVWQQVEEGREAAIARRLIIRKTSNPGHGVERQLAALVHAAEQRPFFLIPDACKHFR